jgi:phosphoribosylaminoimidazolecarboxamide formyltransferase/IMP cyclohydrolase
VKVARALVSVSDKAGVADFARALAGLGVQILSTGGTAKLLGKGRPEGHRGFGAHRLPGDARRPGEDAAPERSTAASSRGATAAEHMAAIGKAGIEPIDLIVVNLYPFQATVADPTARSRTPSRTSTSAAGDAARGGEELRRSRRGGRPRGLREGTGGNPRHGGVAAATRFELAKKVFAHTASYDGGHRQPPVLAGCRQ